MYLKNLRVSPLGLGCMGMTGFYGHTDRDQCIHTIQTAVEEGITFLDTADCYGFGENERLVGSVIAPFRSNVCIATKVGVVRTRDSSSFSINGSPNYIKESCKNSLRRLGVSVIDVYYLHHIDPQTPIEESIEAMAQLVAEGLVRSIGLGEMGAQYIRRAHAVHPITAVQAEYSLFSREAEEQILPVCQELGIGFVACSPMCRGLLSNTINSPQDLGSDDFRRHLPRFQSENLEHNLSIASALKAIAQEKECSLSQLALMWVLAHSPTIIPLVGTTQSNHLNEDIRSLDLSLTQQELERINRIVAKGAVRGDRHPEAAKKLYR